MTASRGGHIVQGLAALAISRAYVALGTLMALTTPVRGDSPQCDHDRCYGSYAIGWSTELAACSTRHLIGLVGSGFDLSHPALTGAHLSAAKFGSKGQPQVQNGGDSTAALSLLVGHDGSAPFGLIPKATVYVADIDETDPQYVVMALDWLQKSHVKIVQFSVPVVRDPLVAFALEGLSRDNVLVKAPVGVTGPTAEPSYPAADPNVIAVTAIDKELRTYPRAANGDYIDMAAPGVGVWAASNKHSFDFQSGTALAASYVTAIAAATVGEDGSSLNKIRFLSALSFVDLGSPGPDPIYGRGLVLAPPACLR